MNIRRVTGLLILILLSALALIIVVMNANKGGHSDNNPHSGMVEVMNGAGGTMWVPLHDELQTADFLPEDFSSQGNYINFNSTRYNTKRGIDVSQHQGEIDWSAVKDDGIEFAYIRAGYRGYSEGGLNEDPFYRKNIEGALANGIEVGIYFFSQAINTAEAVEEAQYVMNLVHEYRVTLPIYFDWEGVANVGETRTDCVAADQITDFAVAFCNEIETHGKSAGVYFYRSQGYYEYDLTRLSNFEYWSAAPGEYPDFYYSHNMWQYSFDGKVKGIEASTDLNLRFEAVDY